MNLAQIIKQLWTEDGPAIAVGEDVAAELTRLCSRCHEAFPHPVWLEMLDAATIDGDESEFHVWLTDTLRDFPPGNQIKMFWFGIVEDFGLDDMDGELLDDPAEEGAPDDQWFDDDDIDDESDAMMPTAAFIYLCGDRYLFTEPRPVERQKGYAYDPPGQQYYPHFIEQYYHKVFGDDEEVDLIATAYLLPAYAGLLIASACRRLDPALLLGPSPSRQIVFGWDEGEPMILGEITSEGWKPRYQPIKF